MSLPNSTRSRKSGVPTHEEFDAEKAKLLAGIAPSSASSSSQPSGADSPQGNGWWQASDGTWYAPELRPDDCSPVAFSSARVDASTPLSLTTQSEQTSGAPPPVAAGTERRRRNTSLLVVLGVLVLVGIAIGGFFLTKELASKSRSSQQTAAQENLQTALTGAATFYTSSNETYDGIMGGTAISSITQMDTGLSFVGASTASTDSSTISLSQSGGEVLVMTAYAPGSGICFGILDVMSPLDAPFFSNYPQTAALNTYYFSSQQSKAGNCNATVISPQHLSSNGWVGPVVSEVRSEYAYWKSWNQDEQSIAPLFTTPTVPVASNNAGPTSVIPGTNGDTVAELESYMKAKITGPKPSGYAQTGVASVVCSPPVVWAPGATFICTAYSSSGARVNYYQLTVLSLKGSFNANVTQLGD